MRNKHVHNQKGLIYKYDKGNFKKYKGRYSYSIEFVIFHLFHLIVDGYIKPATLLR